MNQLKKLDLLEVDDFVKRLMIVDLLKLIVVDLKKLIVVDLKKRIVVDFGVKAVLIPSSCYFHQSFLKINPLKAMGRLHFSF